MVPAVFASFISYSREVGGAGRRRVPQWLRLYEAARPGVKRFVAEFSRMMEPVDFGAVFIFRSGYQQIAPRL